MTTKSFKHDPSSSLQIVQTSNSPCLSYCLMPPRFFFFAQNQATWLVGCCTAQWLRTSSFSSLRRKCFIVLCYGSSCAYTKNCGRVPPRGSVAHCLWKVGLALAAENPSPISNDWDGPESNLVNIFFWCESYLKWTYAVVILKIWPFT